MRHTVFAALMAGALAFSLSAYAQAPDHSHQTGGAEQHDHGGSMNHEDHDKHHGEQGSAGHAHAHANMCEAVVSKSDASVPDIRADYWELVRTAKKDVKTDAGKQTFVYMFYKDKRVPNAKVTVAIATVSPFTQTVLMWEEGDKKMRTVISSNEGVCVVPLYGSDGKRYDILGFMEKILACANK